MHWFGVGQNALRTLMVTEILFLIGLVFILVIGARKNLDSYQKRCLWRKYATYFAVINVFEVAIFAGDHIFYTLLAIIIAFALTEFYQMLQIKGVSPHRGVGIIAGLGVLPASVFGGEPFLLKYVVVCIVLTLLVPIIRNKTESVVAGSSSTLLALLYAAVLPGYLVFIYQGDKGAELTAYLFMMITMNDGFAELFGRSLGKRAIWPQISPNKTWAGSLGGLMSAVCGALLFRFLWPEITMLSAIAIGVIVGLSGQLGDLIASVFKRDANIKDFGNVLPYHGGVLDRFDSLLIAAPVFYYTKDYANTVVMYLQNFYGLR